jgi:hypothetical protein
MVTGVSSGTGKVATGKLAVLLLAGTVTEGGTRAAAVLLLESWTTRPAAGAGPLRVMVAVELPPPTRATGAMATDGVGATTVSWAVWLAPPPVAVTVTGVDWTTGAVVTVKLAAIAPGLTMTDAGTWTTAASLLESWRTRPAAGAGLLRFTVAAELPLPIKALGWKAIRDGWGARTFSSAVNSSEPLAAVIVTTVDCATATVVTGKFADVAPAGTITDAGTWTTTWLLLASRTTRPSEGAGLLRNTPPVETPPPRMTVVPSLSEVRVCALAISGKPRTRTVRLKIVDSR